MYRYNICNEPDKNIFKRQCQALEKHIPNITESKSYVDIDGSESQIYHTSDSKTISVHNSYYIGAVYIDSEIELEKYFN